MEFSRYCLQNQELPKKEPKADPVEEDLPSPPELKREPSEAPKPKTVRKPRAKKHNVFLLVK